VFYVPIGSTQNVGTSVSGGRVPDEYDSSPMLQRIYSYKILKTQLLVSSREENTLQLKVRISHGPDLRDLDVVLGRKVYRVLFLADATCACALDRVRSFEHEGASFACELDRELENLLEFCRVERVISHINGLPVG
jgi:hypothetical protein